VLAWLPSRSKASEVSEDRLDDLQALPIEGP
jgi:hypothetical protein